MRKEEIKNAELQRLITMKSNKVNYEDVNDEDLDAIRQITLNAFAFSVENVLTDINVINLFPNLRELTICKILITQEVLETKSYKKIGWQSAVKTLIPILGVLVINAS